MRRAGPAVLPAVAVSLVGVSGPPALCLGLRACPTVSTEPDRALTRAARLIGPCPVLQPGAWQLVRCSGPWRGAQFRSVSSFPAGSLENLLFLCLLCTVCAFAVCAGFASYAAPSAVNTGTTNTAVLSVVMYLLLSVCVDAVFLVDPSGNSRHRGRGSYVQPLLSVGHRAAGDANRGPRAPWTELRLLGPWTCAPTEAGLSFSHPARVRRAMPRAEMRWEQGPGMGMEMMEVYPCCDLLSGVLCLAWNASSDGGPAVCSELVEPSRESDCGIRFCCAESDATPDDGPGSLRVGSRSILLLYDARLC